MEDLQTLPTGMYQCQVSPLAPGPLTPAEVSSSWSTEVPSPECVSLEGCGQERHPHAKVRTLDHDNYYYDVILIIHTPPMQSSAVVYLATLKMAQSPLPRTRLALLPHIPARVDLSWLGQGTGRAKPVASGPPLNHYAG